MTARPRVQDYMTAELIVRHPEMEILHAMTPLLDKRISGAPVVDAAGAFVGVLSKKDCLPAALNAAYWQEWGSPVSGYMSTKVETPEADMDLVIRRRALSYQPLPPVSGTVRRPACRADQSRRCVARFGGKLAMRRSPIPFGTQNGRV